MPARRASVVCFSNETLVCFGGAEFFNKSTGNKAQELKRPMTVKTVEGSKTNKSAAAIVGPSR